MEELKASNTGKKLPPKQGDYEVGHKRPPKEHQFKPGQSDNPKGPPLRKTQLWVYFCKYVSMTDAEIEKLDMTTLTRSQQMALSLVEKEGKAGSRPLALAIFDREEGRATQTQVVEDKRAKVPTTRAELEESLRKLDELEAEARRIQLEVNEKYKYSQ